MLAPILAGLAGYLSSLGTKVADEVAMHPVKKGVKTLYGEDKPKAGIAPLLMQPQFQSSDPANALAGQLSMPQQQPMSQMSQAPAPDQGGGLFGPEMRQGVGNALLAMGALGLGQNPFQVIGQQQQLAQRRQAMQQQQQQAAQDAAMQQQQLAARQQEFNLSRQDTAAERAARADEFNRKLQYQQQQDQLALQQEQIKNQMAREQFNAEMGIKQQTLGINKAELDLRRQQLQQTQEAMANLGKTLFPDVAQGMEGHQAASSSQYTPEQQALLKAAMSADPTGKTALTMAAQMQKDANAPLTEAAANATMFANRASKANEQINASDYKPGVVSGMLRNFGNGHPLAGPAVSYLLNEFAPGSQEYNVWAEDFTRAALRKESGATITPDEDLRARQLWIPQPNDTPQVLEAKRVARENEIQGMLAAAGPKGQRALGNLSQQQQPNNAHLTDEQLINKYAK